MNSVLQLLGVSTALLLNACPASSREMVQCLLPKNFSAASPASRPSSPPVIVPHTAFHVPIAMYHYIRTVPKNDPRGVSLSVDPRRFDHQLDTYAAKGYQTIGFQDLANSESVLPIKPIILTFDDGYEDAYTEAFPRLVAHGMKGVFYIVTDFVGKPGYVTWDQLREMRNAGMEIAAHTTQHHELSKLSPDNQEYEIKESVKILANALDIRIYSVAYPVGKYSTDTLKIMRTTGVPFAVTTHHGIATSEYHSHELPRVRVNDETDVGKRF